MIRTIRTTSKPPDHPKQPERPNPRRVFVFCRNRKRRSQTTRSMCFCVPHLLPLPLPSPSPTLCQCVCRVCFCCWYVARLSKKRFTCLLPPHPSRPIPPSARACAACYFCCRYRASLHCKTVYMIVHLSRPIPSHPPPRSPWQH